jgi:hypothetical protein
VATPSDDQVRYDILIEAKSALKALQELLRMTASNEDKIIHFSQVVIAQSKQWGVSWQQALNVYKQLNAELSKQKKANLFGPSGGQNMIGLSEKYLSSVDQAGRLAEETSKKFEKAGTAGEQAGKKTQTAFQRAVSAINVVRIALGALVAMLLFNVIQAIQMTFSTAIKQATQFEETLYRLRNVEESLSLNGIEISMKGLKKGIADIQKLLPIFSKEDVSQLVGTLAISTKQLGLNEQQILDLAKAIGILNVRSEKQEDLSTTAQHVLSSILTGNARGITQLGIAFTDNVMKAKAMELGFLEAGEALSTLSENEKGLTKLGIVMDSTGGELSNIGEYLDTNSAKLQKNKAAWADLMTTLGQTILPFIPTATKFFELVNGGLGTVKVAIIETIVLLGTMATAMALVFSGQIKNMKQFSDVIKTSMASFRETLVNQFFKEMPEDAPEWFKKGWGSLIKEEAETATSGINEFGEALDEFAGDEFGNKIEDIIDDTNSAFEDLVANLNRKLSDLDTEYQRKELDALTDLNRKIEDINRDAEREKKALLDKQREDDIRAEQDYQLKLWELRMRYLMDLEDALHARDARQVLRLQKQYAIDKEALERKKNLDDKQREEDQKHQLEDIEIKRRQRIEDAKIEYDQKLADLRISKAREAADLQTWYMRELADLQEAQKRKMEALIAGWIEEKKITAENAAEVYAILQGYFGPGGMTDALYQYMMSSLVAVTQQAALVASMIGSFGGYQPITNSVRTPLGDTGGGNGNRGPGMAEGGTLLATRPTTVTFGEAGMETATFTPLTRAGRNSGRVFAQNGAGAGLNGQIVLDVSLSPDLEARIVRNSMDGVADVILKVSNSK